MYIPFHARILVILEVVIISRYPYKQYRFSLKIRVPHHEQKIIIKQSTTAFIEIGNEKKYGYQKEHAKHHRHNTIFKLQIIPSSRQY